MPENSGLDKLQVNISTPVHQFKKSCDNFLSSYSEKDRVWDTRRQETEDVGLIYAQAQAAEFERYAQRMAACSGKLGFDWLTDKETGEMSLKLKTAQFCRVRNCPVCQWRRQLMWQARFYTAIPKIMAEHPKARWLFLTLTIKNCDITELYSTLTHLNQSWQRLIKRKEFAPVLGWVRSTEITRGKKDGSAHPHFHVLMMVPPSWFTTKYVKHSRWVEIWQSCLRIDYAPTVNIKTVKSKDKAIALDSPDFLRGAVKETLKYSVKPGDMTDDPEWFLELTRQTHRKRVIATGGALKDVLRVEDESNDDLLLLNDEPEKQKQQDEEIDLFFKYWHRHYRREK